MTGPSAEKFGMLILFSSDGIFNEPDPVFDETGFGFTFDGDLMGGGCSTAMISSLSGSEMKFSVSSDVNRTDAGDKSFPAASKSFDSTDESFVAVA